MTDIVAICGAPGAGKTSVCRSLGEALNGSVVSMDVNAAYTSMSPAELDEWIAAGADYNVFSMPQLEAELRVDRPGKDYVFFESHFGRAHQQTGQYIACQVYLALPLELALARQLEKICNDFIASGVAEMGQLHWFKGFLQSYQQVVSPLLASQSTHLQAGADLTVDARKPLDVVVSEIAAYLRTSQ